MQVSNCQRARIHALLLILIRSPNESLMASSKTSRALGFSSQGVVVPGHSKASKEAVSMERGLQHVDQSHVASVLTSYLNNTELVILP